MKLTSREIALARRKVEPEKTRRITSEDAVWRIGIVREVACLMGQQKLLAEALGIHPVHVSRWLSGTRPVPDRYLPQLAEMLEVAA